MDELEKKKFTRFKNMTKKGRDEYLHELEKEMDDLLDDVKSNTQSAATFMARVPEVMKEINVQLCTGIPNGETYKFGVDLGDLNKNLSQADQKAYTKLKIFYAQLKAYMDTGIEESQEAVKQAIEEASQALSEAVADIKESVDGIVMQMEDIVAEIQAGIEDVVNQVKDVIDDAKQQFQELLPEVRQALKEFIDMIIDAIEEIVNKINGFLNGDLSLSDLFGDGLEGFEFGDEELEWQREQIAAENEGFEFGDEELEWQLEAIKAETEGFEFGDEELEWQIQGYEDDKKKKSQQSKKSSKKKTEDKKDDEIKGAENEFMSYMDVSSNLDQYYTKGSPAITSDASGTSSQMDGGAVAVRLGSAVAWELLGQAAELIPKLGKAGGPAVLAVQTALQRAFKAFKESGYMPDKEELRKVLGDFVDSQAFEELMKTPDTPKSLTEAWDKYMEKSDHWFGEGGLLKGDANQVLHNAGTVMAEGGQAIGDLYEGAMQSFNQNVVHGLTDKAAGLVEGTFLEAPANYVAGSIQMRSDLFFGAAGAVGNTALSGVGGGLGAALDGGVALGDLANNVINP